MSSRSVGSIYTLSRMRGDICHSKHVSIFIHIECVPSVKVEERQVLDTVGHVGLGQI